MAIAAWRLRFEGARRQQAAPAPPRPATTRRVRAPPIWRKKSRTRSATSQLSVPEQHEFRRRPARRDAGDSQHPAGDPDPHHAGLEHHHPHHPSGGLEPGPVARSDRAGRHGAFVNARFISKRKTAFLRPRPRVTVRSTSEPSTGLDGAHPGLDGDVPFLGQPRRRFWRRGALFSDLIDGVPASSLGRLDLDALLHAAALAF